MLGSTAYAFCSEFYVVEKAIEVVVSVQGEERHIRIEALYGPDSATRYSTRAYIKEDVTVQPTCPQDSEGFGKKPESVSVWVAYHLPWTARDSADGALAQALGFLGERCGKPQ